VSARGVRLNGRRRPEMRCARTLLTFALLFGLACPLLGQEHDQPDVDILAIHDQVLGALFPVPSGDLKLYEYRVVVRVLPSFDPAKHAIIRAKQDGTFEVVRYVQKNQKTSVWYQMLDMQEETGLQDPKALAARIPVEEQRVNISRGELLNLLERLSKLRISPFLADSVLPGPSGKGVCVDGTSYDLWFETADGQAHFSLYCSISGYEAFEHPLMLWMEEVTSSIYSAPQLRSPSD